MIRVDGSFGRGDAVVIRGPDGAEIGRGLVAYDAEDAAKIVRKSSGDIVLILGIEGRAEMVHRDDMVLAARKSRYHWPRSQRRSRDLVLAPGNPVTSRKKWIAGSLEPKGTLTIDAGAAAALRRGKSLLPAGVIRVDGSFGRGDAVVIRGPDGAEIGRGLVAYDAEDAAKIVRKSSGDIVLILGIEGRAEMVHRDDMVLGGA